MPRDESLTVQNYVPVAVNITNTKKNSNEQLAKNYFNFCEHSCNRTS